MDTWRFDHNPDLIARRCGCLTLWGAKRRINKHKRKQQLPKKIQESPVVWSDEPKIEDHL